MKPFLFPFTCVGASDLATCGQFFKGIRVFQFSTKYMPSEMRTWIDANLVEAVLPDPATCLSFETALAEAESWAQSHRLGAANYAKGYKNRIPFFDATSVSQIRQDIRRADQQNHAADADENATMAAYIFLHMAQSFDIQNQIIVQQMQQQASMEKTLYEDLRGDASLDHLDRIGEFDDPAQYMLLDRLKAWSRVWTATSSSQDLFLTTREAVITLIQEHFPENIDIMPVAVVPAGVSAAPAGNRQQRDVSAFCHKLASTDLARIKESGLLDTYKAPSAASDGLRIFLLPGIRPHQIFGCFADQTNSIETHTPNGADVINTVIGLIEPQDA